MMLHVPEVLSKDEVRALRARLEAAPWVDGRATVGAQGGAVKRNRQVDEHAEAGRELGEVVLAALKRSPLFFAAALPLRIVPPLFNRYEGGETYGFHVDGSVRNLPGGGDKLRTDLSCTLFLCEPDEYEGGELIVNDTYGEHEVKLPAGDLVVYPSSSLHRVAPVTRGARLASFFWVQSLVRDDGRRRLLFELDTSIQALTRTGADPAALLQLTGIYHNLLRQWSET